MIARVLHTSRASQGSHASHNSQFTSGLSKIPTPSLITTKINIAILIWKKFSVYSFIPSGTYLCVFILLWQPVHQIRAAAQILLVRSFVCAVCEYRQVLGMQLPRKR
jgi:hypothetical protein